MPPRASPLEREEMMLQFGIWAFTLEIAVVALAMIFSAETLARRCAQVPLRQRFKVLAQSPEVWFISLHTIIVLLMTPFMIWVVQACEWRG